MSIKFAANLNFLFGEGSPTLIEKLRLAHKAGFRAVEIPYPNVDINEFARVQKKTGIEVSLMNIALDQEDRYRFGVTSIPGAEELFEKHLTDTINACKLLNCKKIHLMAGTVKLEDENKSMETYTKNLKYAAEKLEKENIIGLIEPINRYAVPCYFLNNYNTASKVLKEVNSDNMKLLMDVFHLQHINGNVTNTFKDLCDIIGHIQIAQTPHRHEPNVSGEIDFNYLFSVIEGSGYSDWIGCEYIPKDKTTTGLQWISQFGYQL